MPGIHKMFDLELKKDCFSRCNPKSFASWKQATTVDIFPEMTEMGLDLFLAICPDMLSHDPTDCVEVWINITSTKGVAVTMFLLWFCIEDILADSFVKSVGPALMYDKISTAVQLLTLCVQGIIGCCNDGAEG